MLVRVVSGFVGICAVAAGALLAAGGPAYVATGIRTLLGHSGFILIACAIALLIYNLSPTGAVGGPVVLAVAGGLVLATQRNWWSARSTWEVAGLVMVCTGGALVVRRDHGVTSSGPVRRTTSLLARRTLRFGPKVYTPERLILTSVAARLDVDLHAAQPPQFGPLQIFVSCWGGTVHLDFPDGWAVVAGRLLASRSIRFKGALDSTETFSSPEDPTTEEILMEVAEARKKSAGTTGQAVAAVVHVLGLGGSVTVAHIR